MQHRHTHRLVLGLLATAGLLVASPAIALADGPDTDDREAPRGSSDRDRGSASRQTDSEGRSDTPEQRATHRGDTKTSDLEGRTQGRVSVCHRTDDGWVRITIAEDAVQAHARHGDAVGVIGVCLDEDPGSRHVTLGENLTSTNATQGSAEALAGATHPQVVVHGPWLILLAALGGDAALIGHEESPVLAVSADSTGANAATSAAAVPARAPIVDPLAVGADALVTATWDGTALAVERLEAARPVGGSAGLQAQVFPAGAGNMGFVDAAVGSLLSLSCLALAGVFGSRWLTARRR